MSLYKLNSSLSIFGERVPRGSEIELTDEQVAHFDPSDITLVSATVEPVAEAIVVPIEEMSHLQLKEHAGQLGLSTAGSKAALLERIQLHLTAPAEEGVAEEEVPDQEI